MRMETCDKCGVWSVEAREETTSGSSSRSGVLVGAECGTREHAQVRGGELRL